MVDELDLSAILDDYDGSKGGHPPYDPRMMVRPLVYAYCVGVPSSRKIEKTVNDYVPFCLGSQFKWKALIPFCVGPPASNASYPAFLP